MSKMAIGRAGLIQPFTVARRWAARFANICRSFIPAEVGLPGPGDAFRTVQAEIAQIRLERSLDAKGIDQG